jgi:hypothetical protein
METFPDKITMALCIPLVQGLRYQIVYRHKGFVFGELIFQIHYLYNHTWVSGEKRLQAKTHYGNRVAIIEH